MNPDQPSREQIEARLTALLLGELPAEEAALLRYTIAQDPALKKLHDELQSTLPLIREAAKHPAEAPMEKPAPLKLSAERREKLLAHFKTQRPKVEREPLFWLKRINTPELRTLAVSTFVILAVIGLAVLSVPNFVKTRATSKANAVINNLRQIDAAKAQWALENHKSGNDVPTANDLSPYIKDGSPHSIMGETYVFGKVSEPVAADVDASKKSQLGSLTIATLANGSGKLRATFDEDQLALNTAVQTAAPGQKLAAQPATPPPTPIALPPGQPEVVASLANSTVALAPEPQSAPTSVAPPTTQIVLPPAQSESPEIVGYVNALISSNTFVLAGRPTETGASQLADNNGNKQNAGIANTFASNTGGSRGGFGGFSRFGGGGFGGSPATGGAGHGTDVQSGLNQALVARSQNQQAAGETDQFELAPAGGAPGQAPNTVTFAFDDSGANRNQDLPATADKTFQWSLDSGTAKTPPTQLPRLAFNDDKDQTQATGKFYRERAAQPKDNKVPVAGDSAVAPPVLAPPPPSGSAITGGTFALDIDSDRLHSADRSKLPAQPPGGTLALNGNNSFSSETTVNSGTLNLGVDGRDQNVGEFKLNNADTQQVAQEARRIFQRSATLAQTDPLQQRITASAATDSFQIGLAKENAESLRSLVTNSPQPSSTPQNPNPFVTRYAYAAPISGALQQLQSTNSLAFNGDANNTFNPGVSAITPETIDINGALDRYGKLTGLTVMRSALPSGGEILLPKSLSEKDETTALQAALALNGVSLINIGDKFLKVVPSDQTGSMGETFGEDVNAAAPTPTMDARQLQMVHSQQTENEKIYREQLAQLQKLQSIQQTNEAMLYDVLPQMVQDGTLSDLVGKLREAEQNWATLTNDYSTTNIVVTRVQSVMDELKSEIHDRVNGIMAELGTQVASKKAMLDAITASGEAAKQMDQDLPLRKPAPNTPLPQPEILTSNNAFSTFSLNVSDVSFKFAEASLQNGKLPDTASIRSEEFINAFDYRDPEAAAGQPMAFTAERVRYPFAQNRDLLRFSIKTAAAGRQAGRPLNLVLLLDTSGSMERADRVAIIHEALRVLATQLHENDVVSVVSFARTARLWADGISGDKAGETLDKVGGITPEGGTNLEEAMRLAYETARRHYLANGMNRVVLLTDGAANLGNVSPDALKDKVEAQRRQGIALDCFGIGWEDYNDDLLEELSSNGDGRYAFLNSPEDTSRDFAAKLAGALQVAAEDVKVQVEFNPQRVTSYRQIGYATHQLTKEQFRDNTVAAAPIAAQEAGNALYTIETNPNGDGPIATVHVRYRVPGTQNYHEHSWDVAYTGNATALEKSSPAMRLAATASAFSEWLAASPYAQEVTPDELLKDLSGVPEIYGADDRPKQLETMIREAKSLEGK